MIVLDTDHLSCLEWGSEESATLRTRLAETSDRMVVVSIASYEEQMRGWMALLAKTPLSAGKDSRRKANHVCNALSIAAGVVASLAHMSRQAAKSSSARRTYRNPRLHPNTPR